MPVNMPKPNMKVTIDATLTTRFLKIHSGSMGSLTRLSIIIKRSNITAEKANRKTMGKDSHSYSTPAQVKASINGTTVTMSVTIPL